MPGARGLAIRRAVDQQRFDEAETSTVEGLGFTPFLDLAWVLGSLSYLGVQSTLQAAPVVHAPIPPSSGSRQGLTAGGVRCNTGRIRSSGREAANGVVVMSR